MNRPQSFSSPRKSRKPLKAETDGQSKELWSTLLDSVASGKRLPEKRVVVLGGSSGTQKEFLEVLASDSPKTASSERQKKKPSVANDFALGYTYQDVLDADHEDTLARLSIFTLQDSTRAFSALLKSILTPATIPETLLVILLDWNEPWNWVRQIRDWIRLLHETLSTLDDQAKTAMQESMQAWEQRRRGGTHDAGATSQGADNSVNVPLGPGEWDEALGLPLCVVCHNSDRIDILEREHGWREEDFDYILQFMRTILLKHGSSLIYTSNSIFNSLPLLVQSSLDIHSIMKRQPLKHNVVDREKILIPPNWDSWGKIRVLRDGFEVERVSEQWSLEIQPSQHSEIQRSDADPTRSSVTTEGEPSSSELLVEYENAIRNPSSSRPRLDLGTVPNGIEIETVAMQNFLAEQADAIERLKVEEQQSNKNAGKDAPNEVAESLTGRSFTIEDTSRVKEHVGPIQFNMGGIQLDAEDMLNRIKERTNRDEEPQITEGKTDAPQSPGVDAQGKPRQEALASFFAGLIKKSGGASAPGTPPPKEKTKSGQ